MTNYSKKKGGRPKKPEHMKLKHQVKVNLTEEEYKTLKLQATIGGISMSEAARHGIHRVKIRQPVSPEHFNFRKDIFDIAFKMQYIAKTLMSIRDKGLSDPEVSKAIECCVEDFNEEYSATLPALRDLRSILINTYDKQD